MLSPHWTSAKVDAAGLAQLLKTRQQMNELGYTPDPSTAVMYFLTSKLSDKEIADMQKLIPRRDFVESWRNLEGQGRFRQAPERQGSFDPITDLEVALGEPSRDDFVLERDRTPASGDAEDQELLHQMAASAAKSPIARICGALHHAANTRLRQDC